MDGEADLIRMLADDLDGNAGYVQTPVCCVGAVREGAFDEREGLTRGLEQRQGAVAILDRSSMGLEHKCPPIGIDESTTFAALHLLAGIPRVAASPRPRTGAAARPAGLGGLDTLAVEYSRPDRGLEDDG